MKRKNLGLVIGIVILLVISVFAQERLPSPGDCFDTPAGIWQLTKLERINETTTFTEAYNFKLDVTTNDTMLNDIQLNGLFWMILENKIECPFPPDPVGFPFSSCNEDKSICSSPGKHYSTPYVKQDPIYINVYTLPFGFFVTRSYRILGGH